MTGARSVQIPSAPVLVTRARDGLLMFPDGEVTEFTAGTAKSAVEHPVIQCHGRATAARLGLKPVSGFDVLELYAFVRPGQFSLPTVRGLAAATGTKPPVTMVDDAVALIEATRALLDEVMSWDGGDIRQARAITHVLERAGWSWGPSVLAAIGADPEGGGIGLSPLRVWTRLTPFEDHAPPPPPGNDAVSETESRERLTTLLGDKSEDRESQATYAAVVSHAFKAKPAPDEPNLVLAEAGTGIGKTLGYLAPASVWAEKNHGAVWVSTFTRNLQRQLDQELDRLFPDEEAKAHRVVVRKGRENYFCLLNYEEALNRSGTDPSAAIPLALIARWIVATKSGDMVGGDFPSWLADLFGTGRVLSLADRRGECVFTACPHYRTCFVEKTVRKARTADIVVANHALVMVQAAMGGLDDGTQPTRYVFDEGHHLFGAADSAFSAHLSAAETADLRRWLVGAEAGGRPTRSRGLKRRIDDLLSELDADGDAMAMALDGILQGARSLPAPGWLTRLEEGQPRGPAEAFLRLVRTQVYTRDDPESPYSLQTDAVEPVDGLMDAAATLDTALTRLVEPVKQLVKALSQQLERPADELDTASRTRIESLCRSLERRAVMPLTAWQDMIKALSSETPKEFVDWLGVDRIDGRDTDIGLHRHWVDPTLPFARAVLDPAQGVAITSATLRDGTGDNVTDWESADQQVGSFHIASTPVRSVLTSPFNYAENTRVYIVNDLRKDAFVQVANAYRDLFLAADGGALGLFTAISRLKATFDQIAPVIEGAGLPLYAQHVDPLPTASLVDIFRAEEKACLLGTDAMRDGVDVPGRSLQLMVFDRVPWPRPDILHRARREAFGTRAYDDRITRLRLKQAFGRLIRRDGDKGVFVLLDSMMPSRLLGAFPEGTPVERVSLAEAVAGTKAFLNNQTKE
ncbi:MAG: ATP-dependent DNA helicase [Rhodospirillaceae bacterium]|nr:ATP-dependent DNA helicase [Rhodospirillaceae bacterium]